MGRAVRLARTTIAVSRNRAVIVSVQVRNKSIINMTATSDDDGYSAVAPDMSEGMAIRIKQIASVGREGRRLIVGCDGMPLAPLSNLYILAIKP